MAQCINFDTKAVNQNPKRSIQDALVFEFFSCLFESCETPRDGGGGSCRGRGCLHCYATTKLRYSLKMNVGQIK